MDYRARIYANYASQVQGQSSPASIAEAERWGKPFEHHLRRWLPDPRDAPIVDVACGFGRLLHFFSSRGYTDVIGVDHSSEQVSHAKALHPRVFEASALDFLESHPCSFAMIAGFDIVEHLTKNEVVRFLDACYGALRPGGRLVLKTINGASPWGFDQRCNDFTHEVGFNPTSLRSLVEICGLEDVETREAGPAPHGIVSALRFGIWQLIRLVLIGVNLVETGTAGDRVLTRVFLLAAIKR